MNYGSLWLCESLLKHESHYLSKEEEEEVKKRFERKINKWKC